MCCRSEFRDTSRAPSGEIDLCWVETSTECAATLDGMGQHTSVVGIRKTTTVTEARAMHPAVGRGRLYAALRQGRVRSAKVGKRIAIDVVDLDRWVMAGAPVTCEESGSHS